MGKIKKEHRSSQGVLEGVLCKKDGPERLLGEKMWGHHLLSGSLKGGGQEEKEGRRKHHRAKPKPGTQKGKKREYVSQIIKDVKQVS